MIARAFFVSMIEWLVLDAANGVAPFILFFVFGIETGVVVIADVSANCRVRRFSSAPEVCDPINVVEVIGTVDEVGFPVSCQHGGEAKIISAAVCLCKESLADIAVLLADDVSERVPFGICGEMPANGACTLVFSGDSCAASVVAFRNVGCCGP